jgi:hypothetical protein
VKRPKSLKRQERVSCGSQLPLQARPKPKVEEPAKPKVDEPSKQKADEPSKQKVDEPAKSKVDERAKQKVDEPSKPKVEEPPQPEAAAELSPLDSPTFAPSETGEWPRFAKAPQPLAVRKFETTVAAEKLSDFVRHDGQLSSQIEARSAGGR